MAWFVSASVVSEQSMTGHMASAGSYWRVMAHPKHTPSQSWNSASSAVVCYASTAGTPNVSQAQARDALRSCERG